MPPPSTRSAAALDAVGKLDPGFVAVHGLAGKVSAASWSGSLVRDLLLVTIGNVVRGALLVGVVYWFMYPVPSATQKGGSNGV